MDAQVIIGGAVAAVALLLGRKRSTAAKAPKEMTDQAIDLTNKIQQGMVKVPMITINQDSSALLTRRILEQVGITAATVGAVVVGGLITYYGLSAVITAITTGVSAGGWVGLVFAAYIAIILVGMHFLSRATRWQNWWRQNFGVLFGGYASTILQGPSAIYARYTLKTSSAAADFVEASFSLVIEDDNKKEKPELNWKVTKYTNDFRGVQTRTEGVYVENIPLNLLQAVSMLSLYSGITETWAWNESIYRFYRFRGWSDAQMRDQGIAVTGDEYWQWIVDNSLCPNFMPPKALVNDRVYAPFPAMSLVYMPLQQIPTSLRIVANPDDPNKQVELSYDRSFASAFPDGEMVPMPALANKPSFAVLEEVAHQAAGPNRLIIKNNAIAVGEIEAMTRAAIDGYSFGWPGDEAYTRTIAQYATTNGTDWTAFADAGNQLGAGAGAWWLKNTNTSIYFNVVKSRETESPFVYIQPAE